MAETTHRSYTLADHDGSQIDGQKKTNGAIQAIDGDIAALFTAVNEKASTAEIAALIDSAPSVLDSLAELAAAVNNDPDFGSLVVLKSDVAVKTLEENEQLSAQIRPGWYRLASTHPDLPDASAAFGQMQVVHGGLDTITYLVYPYSNPSKFWICSGNPSNVGGAGALSAWVEFSSNAIEVGTSIMFNGTNAPPGYLKENGAAVSRTTFEALFAVIGTTHGAGDGSTTFNLPDSRGEFFRGLDDGRGVDSGRSLGQHQTDQNKSHTHTGGTDGGGGHSHSASTGSAGSHNHSGSTGSAGNHKHNVENRTGYGGSRDAPVVTPDGAPTNGSTNYAGNHTHSLSINSNGNHTHTVSVGSVGDHTHTFTTNAEGGTEARPRNQAKLVCIKY